MNRGCVAGVILVLLLVPGRSAAVTTETWRVSGRERFVASELESLSVSNDGTVSLAPALEEVPDFNPEYVWCLTVDSKGSVWAGTGTGGELYAVSGEAARLVHDSVSLQVESIAVGRDGTVYAGTAPDATIIAVAKDGTARTFVDLPERHVWGLAIDAAGNLLAATGDRARLYRIDGQGNPKVVYEGSADHFTSLAVRGNEVLLGADQEGLLYSVSESGRARILMDAEEAEVKALVVAADGTAFAAVNPPAGVADPAATARKPAPVLYRISGDGVVEPVWSAPENFIQSIALAKDGSIYAATGGTDAGSLYRVVPESGDWSLLSRPGPPQILAVALAGDVLWAGAGSPGKLYRGSLSGSPLGRLTSEVHDAKQVADWGVLRWERGEAESGGTITFRTRSGNSKEPDATWSDWSEPVSTSGGSPIGSPAGRFIQWQAEFRRGNGGSPALHEVTVAYLEKNLTPQFRSFDVSAPGLILSRGGDESGPQPVVQNLSGNVRAEFSISSQVGRGPADDEDAAWARRYRTLKWDANDPNDDPLEYRVEYRGRGETAWRPLTEELRDPLYVFDSSQVSDGVYRFRVTATDAPRNPPGEAREVKRESDFVVVDNTPPVIDGLAARREGGKIRVTATLRDLLSPLKLAEASLDGKEWRPVHPVDRVMDEVAEEINVDFESPGDGPATVILRASDLAGNVGVSRVAL